MKNILNFWYHPASLKVCRAKSTKRWLVILLRRV
jgi:hypothetical protein